MASSARVRRGMVVRWVVLAVLTVIAAAMGPRSASGQQVPCQRFDISSARDTTFTFALVGRDDIVRGRTGRVVDPRRKDALVARFQVLRVDGGVATALVTGQTADVATAHIALVDETKSASGTRSFFRSATFWIGALIGVAAGVAVGSGL